jgi:maleate isomerase
MQRGHKLESVIRIGVVTPHSASGPEVEFPAMAPGRVLTCVACVSPEADQVAADVTPSSGPGALSGPLSLDETADLMGRGSLDVIAYASTSTAYAIGFDEEAALVSTLSRRVGLPVSATCASAVVALRVLDVERIALVHPPWFDAELNELGAGYFRGEGFDVVSSTSADLSRDPSRIEAAAVCEWASRQVADDAEAVFFGGNGFRAAGAISAMEARLDRPVLTSNQVLLWDVLASTGATFDVEGYGRLFRHKPSHAQLRLR